jgi:hypothetical protein
MLKSLTVVETLEGELVRMKKSAGVLQQLLEVSPASRSECCDVEAEVAALLEEEQHLQQVATNISGQVLSKEFLPQAIEEEWLLRVEPSFDLLPAWVTHCLKEEYGLARAALSSQALLLFQMHQLDSVPAPLLPETEMDGRGESLAEAPLRT